MQLSKRYLAHRLGQLITASCFAAISAIATPAAAASHASGIAGHVVEGPITPVCLPNVPCTRPFANATVLVLDAVSRAAVARAVTDMRGNFRVRVRPGAYLAHVQVIDFPRCPEVPARVRKHRFTFVRIACDTRLR